MAARDQQNHLGSWGTHVGSAGMEHYHELSVI